MCFASTRETGQIALPRLDFDGLVNAIGELCCDHIDLIRRLLAITHNDALKVEIDGNVVFHSKERALETVGARSNVRRAAVGRIYQDDAQVEEEGQIANYANPSVPGRRDSRLPSELTELEHCHIFNVIQSLERHEDATILHLRGSHKQKVPTPIPIFSSVRTKARRKRYKCLQDFLEHANTVWEQLGKPSECLQAHFNSLIMSYFPNELLNNAASEEN